VKRLPALALSLGLLVTLVGGQDINFKPAGGGVSAASPTFTGTLTFDRLNATGTVPTSCAVTGAGASGSCALVAGSTDSAGTVEITTDASGTAATGTLTLTFAAAQGTVDPVCMAILTTAGVSWSTTSTIRVGGASATTACSWTWNNTSALTASDTYRVSYVVIGL